MSKRKNATIENPNKDFCDFLMGRTDLDEVWSHVSLSVVVHGCSFERDHVDTDATSCKSK